MFQFRGKLGSPQLKITTAMLDASINAIAMLQALARLGNMCDVMSLDGIRKHARERDVCRGWVCSHGIATAMPH